MTYRLAHYYHSKIQAAVSKGRYTLLNYCMSWVLESIFSAQRITATITRTARTRNSKYTSLLNTEKITDGDVGEDEDRMMGNLQSCVEFILRKCSWMWQTSNLCMVTFCRRWKCLPFATLRFLQSLNIKWIWCYGFPIILSSSSPTSPSLTFSEEHLLRRALYFESFSQFLYLLQQYTAPWFKYLFQKSLRISKATM